MNGWNQEWAAIYLWDRQDERTMGSMSSLTCALMYETEGLQATEGRALVCGCG